jgi:hypothetical protein
MNAMPTPSPQMATSLGLRPETFLFPDELGEAWKGNGCQTYKLNTIAVFAAVWEFWRTKRPSMTTSDLKAFLMARHPLLFNQAKHEVIARTA